jgi:nicotinate-nucleotide adenylyltransferase
VAETALRRLALDRVWWVVTPGNPLKDGSALAHLAERMALCRALITDPRMTVTGFENSLSGAYTASTLVFLRTRFPRTHFVWVMGADNLATFHRWRDWRRIAALVPIAVVDRPDWRLRALSSPAARALEDSRVAEASAARLVKRRLPAWVYLGTRLSDDSSTAIRKNMKI